MGRHRSTLRDLGWGASNSPNPWKQGSAKRVVRTLDYSQAELDDVAVEPAAEPRAAQQENTFDERLHQLQQDGRHQLDRIREQFEAQDAENKRKLDRLNGRIAELGEGKRAMWSVLGQVQVQKPMAGGQSVDGEAGAADAGMAQRFPRGTAAAAGPARPGERDAVARKPAEPLMAGAVPERKDDGVRRELDMNAEVDEVDLVGSREAAVAEREAALTAREVSLREAEALLATSREQLNERERELSRKEEALTAREQQHAEAQARFEKKQQLGATGASDARSAGEAGGAAKTEEPAAKTGVELAPEPARFVANSKQQPWKGDAKDDADAKQQEERAKVRFNDKAAAPQPMPQVTKGESKPVPAGKSKSEADAREIQCDTTADWLRAENLTASLKRQGADNPDEVFHPLPSQRTCELTDIFSAPRRAERGKGSGDWTPASEEAVRAQPAPQAQKEKPVAVPGSGPAPLHILGCEGEYMGEQIAMPVFVGPSAPTKTILLGRSSSCDVTLSRDDQISRRHLQVEARDGRLFVRDLGSTYGTRINNKTLGAESAELKVGDVLGVGASSFQLLAA